VDGLGYSPEVSRHESGAGIDFELFTPWASFPRERPHSQHGLRLLALALDGYGLRLLMRRLWQRSCGASMREDYRIKDLPAVHTSPSKRPEKIEIRAGLRGQRSPWQQIIQDRG
jgi:hypothetical protein